MGLYHVDVPAVDLTQLGHYQYAWVSTGTGAGVAPGDFDVYDPYEVAVLSLQDAKDALNIPQATTTSRQRRSRRTSPRSKPAWSGPPAGPSSTAP